MPLLITEVAIQANGTWAIEITNTDTVNPADTTGISIFVGTNGASGFGYGLSSMGVPASIPAGTTFTFGHSSISGLDYYNAGLNHTFVQFQTLAIGPPGDVLVDPRTADDSIGMFSGPLLGVDRNYSSVTGRTPHSDFATSSNVSDFTLSTPFSTADLGTAICFLPGTLIATLSGERTIETLKIGELIRTAEGKHVPARWIGRQSVKRGIGCIPERLEPVCIRGGALGNDLPHSDLIVTADHGMLIDGSVINASALVNGTTIDWVPLSALPNPFLVYHIETENHDVILANGAPAETFVDIPGRQAFDNYQEYLDLYGTERIVPEMDRPRITSRRLVPEAIKARLGIPAEPVFDWDNLDLRDDKSAA